jgi:hypothetical protein
MLNCKKLLSMALACAMAASLAVPAFAATSTSSTATTENTTNRSLKVTGAYQAVTIDVVVPTTGTVIIDPYKLPVSIASGEAKASVQDQQIVTQPMAIKNKSNTTLSMNISTTVLPAGNLKLADSTDAIAEGGDLATANAAYIKMFVEPTELAGDNATDADIVQFYADTYADNSWSGDSLEMTYDSSSKSATTLDPMVNCATLTAAEFESDAFKAYAEGSIAVIAFTGECVQEPTTAWATKDSVTITLAFTFTPASSVSSGASEEVAGG